MFLLFLVQQLLLCIKGVFVCYFLKTRFKPVDKNKAMLVILIENHVQKMT